MFWPTAHLLCSTIHGNVVLFPFFPRISVGITGGDTLIINSGLLVVLSHGSRDLIDLPQIPSATVLTRALHSHRETTNVTILAATWHFLRGLKLKRIIYLAGVLILVSMP